MPEVNEHAAAEAGTAILELPAQVAKKPSFAERAAERDLVVGMKLRADALAMTDKIMRLRALRLARDLPHAAVPEATISKPLK